MQYKAIKHPFKRPCALSIQRGTRTHQGHYKLYTSRPQRIIHYCIIGFLKSDTFSSNAKVTVGVLIKLNTSYYGVCPCICISSPVHGIKRQRSVHGLARPILRAVTCRTCLSTNRPCSLWASNQIHKIAGCACAGNAGVVFPATAG